MSEVVLNSLLLLCLSVFRASDRKARWQIEAFLVFAVPALQGILGRVTQLQNGRPDTLAEPYIELDRSDPIFS